MAARIEIPHNALVLLVGPAGSGKSTFAAKHFRASEIVSSDKCREMVSDNMEDMACSSDAFDLLHYWIDKRLKRGRLTVADATSLTESSRAKLRGLGAAHGAPVVVFALETPVELCHRQNKERTRYVPPHVIDQHYRRAREVIPTLEKEGYEGVHRIVPRSAPVEVVIRQEGVTKSAYGYDVIGDVHGCMEELTELVRRLGYGYDLSDNPAVAKKLVHPTGRKLVFVGDFTDRGPQNVEVLRFLKEALLAGHEAVAGNHDNKLARFLKGNKVAVAHGLQRTIEQLGEYTTEEERQQFRTMLEGLPYYVNLTVPGHPDLVVCHAGMPRDMVGRSQTGPVKSHCLYGETSGETDAQGYPVRGINYVTTWTMGDEEPVLVHGHTVEDTPFPYMNPNVVNVDQGCVFGGKLTAFRYPEYEIVQVPAQENYAAAWAHRMALASSDYTP